MDPTPVSTAPVKPDEKAAPDSPAATRPTGEASGKKVTVGGASSLFRPSVSEETTPRTAESRPASRAKAKHEAGESGTLSERAVKKEQTRRRLASGKQPPAAAPVKSPAAMETEVLAQVRGEIAAGAHAVPATKTKGFTAEARGRLVELAARHPALVAMLERAAARKLTLSGMGPEDIALHLGPMAYPLECGAGTGRQIHRLQALLDGFPSGHVILGWCPGNVMQSKPGLLTGALGEHERVLAESGSPDRARLTVHSAAYQSPWNPEVVGRHFEGLKCRLGDTRDAIGPKKLADETRKRLLDGKRFEAQTNHALPPSTPATPAPGGSGETPATPGKPIGATAAAAGDARFRPTAFDALIAEAGGRILSGEESGEKSAHVAAATGEIRDILGKLRSGQERECIEFRRLLAERQLTLRQYARQRLLNKQVSAERALLQQNQRDLVKVAKERFAADGAEKQRRVELALHSMDVLEQTAVSVLDPASFPKRDLRSGDAPLQDVFPSEPQNRILDPDAAGFYSRLFDAVADDKSTAYVASQEYEFTIASKDKPILYVYTTDPGPFITEEAKPRVSLLIGQALNVSGVKLQPIVSQLHGNPDKG